MYKVSVIGNRNDVLGFMALGFSVCECIDIPTARLALQNAASCGEYAVIFITENYADPLADEIEKYKDQPIPAILPIPCASLDNGYGLKAIHQSVERAVGSDIL